MLFINLFFLQPFFKSLLLFTHEYFSALLRGDVCGGGRRGRAEQQGGGEKEKGHQQGVGMAWWRFIRG